MVVEYARLESIVVVVRAAAARNRRADVRIISVRGFVSRLQFGLDRPFNGAFKSSSIHCMTVDGDNKKHPSI